MQIIAHRGASAYQPENTIEAFRVAQQMGCNYFETDVQMTKDGSLVLWHDYDIDTHAGKLAGLEELLAILRPGDTLNIEIKNDGNLYPGIEEKILNLLSSGRADIKEQILISSFDYPTLQRVRALDKNIKIGVLTKNFNLEEALAIAAYSVNISIKIVNKEIVDICHKNNLKVLVYTVNTPEEAAAMAAIKVDGIFSDYPNII